MFTTAHSLSLYWVRWIKSTPFFLPFYVHFNITTHLCLRLRRCFVFQVCPPFKKVFSFFLFVCYKPRPIYLSWFDHSNNRGESTNHGNFRYKSLSGFPLLRLSFDQIPFSAFNVFSNTFKVRSASKVRDHFEVHVKEREELVKYKLFSVANF